METKNDTSPIETACLLAGGQSALASILGVSTPTVNQWVKKTRPVPRDQATAIEKALGGKVTRKDFFPETWKQRWPELETA